MAPARCSTEVADLINYPAEDVPDDVLGARRGGEGSDVSVVFASVLLQGPHLHDADGDTRLLVAGEHLLLQLCHLVLQLQCGRNWLLNHHLPERKETNLVQFIHKLLGSEKDPRGQTGTGPPPPWCCRRRSCARDATPPGTYPRRSESRKKKKQRNQLQNWVLKEIPNLSPSIVCSEGECQCICIKLYFFPSTTTQPTSSSYRSCTQEHKTVHSDINYIAYPGSTKKATANRDVVAVVDEGGVWGPVIPAQANQFGVVLCVRVHNFDRRLVLALGAEPVLGAQAAPHARSMRSAVREVHRLCRQFSSEVSENSQQWKRVSRICPFRTIRSCTGREKESYSQGENNFDFSCSHCSELSGEGELKQSGWRGLASPWVWELFLFLCEWWSRMLLPPQIYRCALMDVALSPPWWSAMAMHGMELHRST